MTDEDARARVRRLAAARDVRAPRRMRRVADRLRGPQQALEDVRRRLAESGGEESGESAAAEWLLDNDYVVERAFRQIRDEFPAEFERQLPCAAEGSFQGCPRAYVLARELVTSAGDDIELGDVVELIDEFQKVRPLSMAETWALPVLLRVVALERLAAAATAIAPGSEAHGPAAPTTAVSAAPVGPTVASCIRSLLMLEKADWKAFFERISETERILGEDPAQIYPRQDFETRDRCRKAVEELAAGSHHREEAVAREAVRRSHDAAGDRAGHVGYHLLDAGFDPLASALGYRASLPTRLRRLLTRSPTTSYLVPIAVVTLLHEAGLCAGLVALGADVALVAVAAALALAPVVTVAVTLVNAVLTRVLPPRVLPKMDFREGIPPDCRTVVAIPAMVADAVEVSSLLSRAEVHWLAASDPNLRLVLLTDFVDAPAQTMPDDDDLLARAREGILALNGKHGRGGVGPFHLLHRARRWNASEGCWMGWERKRGKLVELNRILAGDSETSFALHVGDRAALHGVRFVITLDADTDLPRESARRLVATLAHPLNRAEFDDRTGRVTAGYTILQPRIELKPFSAAASPLARVLAGDAGLDLYTRTVSDVYQDLFGEGVYLGKGIYDPVAFERSLRGRVPENAILSHDLFEGLHGRVGVATDVVVLEDYPSDYLGYVRRLRRWAQGDWQLLPWLGCRAPIEGGGKAPSRLSTIARWKIVDNLRRTLLAPSLLGFLLAAWAWFPGPATLWTGLGLLSLAAPALTEAMGGLLSPGRITGFASTIRGVAHSFGGSAARWLLHVVFLPHRTAVLGDACVRTLYRLTVVRRGLLEWMPAAQTARDLALKGSRARLWREMSVAPVVAVGALAWLAVVRPGALPAALPLAALWILSPEVAAYVSRPRRRRTRPLSEHDARDLRLLARRTWLFFETFVGPEDQWLPPDHFQEEPRGEVARRTSPTNIGLLQLSILAAHDFGFAGLLSVSLRLKSTFETLGRMERYRGHFYNWYDTRDLAPLPPRYVSTVDSGNLAASLLAVERGCLELADAPVIGVARWDGLLDTVGVLEEVVERASRVLGATPLAALRACIATVRDKVTAVRDHPEAWWSGVAQLLDEGCPELDRELLAAIGPHGEGLAPEILGELRAWSAQTHQDVAALRRDIELWLPWQAFLASSSALARGEVVQEPASDWAGLRSCLPADPTVKELPAACETALTALSRLDLQLRASPHGEIAAGEATAWAVRLAAALTLARDTAQGLLATLEAVARQAATLCAEMDFGWLYDERRRLFFIGYNVTAEALEEHHYDLLASEARLASFVAIAKGDVPEEHWVHLGRHFSRAAGATTLLSWSGTMFEYLMPSLLLREGEDSLIGRAVAAAVQAQIAYAQRHDVPWGISESGYYRLDAHQNYQYRAFGVPDLGFNRGLADDLVVAPYACVLALRLAPDAALANLGHLRRLGLAGRYGFYEAIDFTPSRLPAGSNHAVVRSFMAHHQGMILCALDNLLHDDALVRRFHAEPVVQTAEALLFERPALGAPVERTRHELEGRTPAARRIPAIEPWSPPAAAAFPQAHLLSNGRLRVLATEGGGSSSWGELCLTRWRPDATLDDCGLRLYLRDPIRGAVWSPTVDVPQTVFHAHAVETHHWAQDVSVRQQICVAPEDDVEIRYVTLTNEAGWARTLEITSYAEVVLGSPVEDRRHPAFSNLFVESEYLEELHALVFRRRQRSPREPSGWLVHMMVLPEARARPSGHEGARDSFVGRGRSPRSPAALARDRRSPAATTGAVLDPIMSLSGEIDLPARAATSLAYLLIAADSRQRAIALARRHRSLRKLEWDFELARRMAEAEVADAGLTASELPRAQALLSLLLYPHHGLRAPADILAHNRAGQRSLWRHALSGDLPILLVRVVRAEDAAVLQWILRVHRFWRRRGAAIDVVILDEHPGGYGEETQESIARAVRKAGAEAWSDRPGGVFVIRSAQIAATDRILLLTAARVVLEGTWESVDEHLARLAQAPARLPPLVPSRAEIPAPEPLERPDGLLFDNGIGGFGADGREYVVHLEPGDSTPAPWVNVVANPRFGFVVSESGGGYTWAENSGENRLTPWRGDPVCDEPGEVVYLRDEETAAVWSPTPRPAPADGSYQVRHGAGYTAFRHRSHGLDQDLLLWVTPDDPLKIIQLRLRNRLERQRRVTVTYYAEWVLGTSREISQPFVITEFEPESEALLANNPWHEDFGERVAFVAASEKLHGLTADRREFLGRRGSYAAPAALRRIGLASAVRPGLDPCAAVQVHVNLAPGASTEVHFLLGQGASRDQALALIARYRDRTAIEAAWAEVGRRWDALLGAVEIHTPEPALDVMVNGWLLRQTLASRLWGRTGYYQSGGAFGFRDQLQDVAALVHAAPDLCRAHLLEAARHQFEAGDVLHWWHPPSGAGVRTRCSDDLLWLPFVTAHYVAATGDEAVLSEEVPYLAGEPLRPDEIERYGHFPSADRRATLYEHCLAALARGRTAGAHGLPLIGSGDWNDGMNRVGIAGRGESVWLGWFLHAGLTSFAPLAERVGEVGRAEELRRQAAELRRALEGFAWDGAWYRRGYYDDGVPLGSAESEECRIDSIAQSWAVLSSAADPGRAAAAIEAVCRHLVREGEGLILLFAPPFAASARDPGYVRAYPPGIRENGGQYTHAAIWVLWALADIGDPDRAMELFKALLPIRHAATRESVARYRVEPYVLAADVYAGGSWDGRGGWTWYTGAAAWAYRFLVEGILGIRLEGGAWRLDPQIPRSWPGFEVVLRDGATAFRIRVENPHGVTGGVARVIVDGDPVDSAILPRLRDRRSHDVRVTLGPAAKGPRDLFSQIHEGGNAGESQK